MAHGSRVCPHCGALNGVDESSCYRCKRRLPGAVGGAALEAWHGVIGSEFVLTKFYLGFCIAVYGLCLVGQHAGGLQDLLFGGLRPSQALRYGALVSGLVREEPWRYLSAMFVHAGVLHLVLNMVALADLGRVTEQRIGGARFVVIFIVTGILGFVASDLWYALMHTPLFTVGASGGLFGLMGAIIGYLFARKDPAWKTVLVRFLVYALLFAFAFPVNNSAHAGGFAIGFVLGFLFEKERRPLEHRTLFGWAAGLLVAASLASVVLSARSPAWQLQRQAEIADEPAGVGL